MMGCFFMLHINDIIICIPLRGYVKRAHQLIVEQSLKQQNYPHFANKKIMQI